MITTEQSLPFSDLSLSRRLERAEGRGYADFVEARAKLFPESEAEWIEVAGAYAMFDGIGSPMTQTFGLGVFDPVTKTDMENLEAFFQRRGAHVHHEVSPLAEASLLTGVALLAGASTIPEGRRQGAQLALLESRLRYAVEKGCDIAMMCALPGSASQRNAERQGFRVAYTRIKGSQSRPSN
jgi:hypothetical protein